jgi:phage baseplate assembly protein W
MMAIQSDWGGDLSIGPTGDLVVLPIRKEVGQKVTRGLLTNPGDYVWHADYGAGLAQYVGEPFTANIIENSVINQLRQEVLISIDPPPMVEVNQIQGSPPAVSLSIKYQLRDSSTTDITHMTIGASTA